MTSKNKTSKAHTAPSKADHNTSMLGGASGSPASPDGPKRPPRIRLHAGQNLHISEAYLDREKFSYRWFAESSVNGGRVASAHGAYWEHVTDEHGQNFKRPSGQDTMYLMKLEIQYWLEDQQLKRNKVRATMDKEYAISEGEYAPDEKGFAEGGKSAVTRR